MANTELPADDAKPEPARRQALTDEWQLPAIPSVDDLCTSVAKLCQQAGFCPHTLSQVNETQSPRPVSINSKSNSNSEAREGVIDNTNATTRELTSVKPITPSSYDARVASALSACDVYALSARAAAATISVIGDERLGLVDETAALDARVARDELDIQRLRAQLRRELLIVEYHKELDSLAKQIDQHPPLSQLSEELSRALAKSASIDAQVDVLECARTRIVRELKLLSRAAHAVSESTQDVARLVSEQSPTDAQTFLAPPNLVPSIVRTAPASENDDQPINTIPALPASSEMDVSSRENRMDTS